MIRNYLNSIKDAEIAFYNFQSVSSDPYSLDSEIDFVWNLLTIEFQAKLIRYGKAVIKILDGGELSRKEKEDFAWGVNQNVTTFNIPDYVSY